MERLRHTLLLALMASATTTWASQDRMDPTGLWEFRSAPEAWSIEVVAEDATGTTVEFLLNRLEITREGDRESLYVEGLVNASSPGLPELPAWAGVFAVPDRAGLDLQILESETRTLAPVTPLAATDWQSDLLGSPLPGRHEDPAVYGGSSYPAQPATYGAPALWHGVRVVPLDLMPFSWNASSGELTVYTRLRVRLGHQGSDMRNLRESGPARSVLARQFVLPELQNPGLLQAALRLDPLSVHSLGRYLVIIPDAGVGYLDPWVQWKRQMGYEVTVVLRSEIGTNPDMADIKNVVSQEYTANGLDYLLLVGDYDSSPQLYNIASNTVQGGNYAESTWGGDIVSDHEYTLLEGTDYFPEILVGRLSVDSHQQLTTLVTKLVGYEKTPPINSADNWYRDALMIYDVALAGSRRETKLAVRDMLYADGYVDIDTIHNDYYFNNLSPAIVTNYVNQGVGIINYRGYGHRYQWVGPEFGVSHIANDLTNFNAWPIVTSIVCGGGDFGSSQYDPCFGEAWLRASSGPSPKGAVAFIGPSELDTHTKWNNAIDLGFYQGLLRENIRAIGALMMRGKLELWTQFPNERDEDWSVGGAGNCVPHYFHSYNLLGDPAMAVRTREPLELVLDAPEQLAAGPRQVAVRVTASETGQPVSGAHVYFYQAENQSGRLAVTDDNGQAWLDLGLVAEGSYLITVHGDNLYPVQQAVTVGNQPSALSLTGVTVADQGDGLLNPGETFSLVLDLYEAGTEGLTGEVDVTLVCQDTRLTLNTDTATLTPPAPGGNTLLAGFGLTLAQAVPNGTRIPLDFWVDGSWLARTSLEVVAADYAVSGVTALDGDTEPGSTFVFELELQQLGQVSSPAGSVRLHAVDGGVDLQDEWGTLPALAQDAFGTAGPFALSLSPDLLPGTVIAFELEYLSADNVVLDRRPWSLTAGQPGPGDPQGPDGAGYVIYDSGDTGHVQAPVYEWTDISGVGTDLDMVDEQESWQNGGMDGSSRLVDLPFMFTFYGLTWATLTVNSNGWVAMGDCLNFIGGHNTSLPAAQGPPGMIAVFWTDLLNFDGNEFGDVYTWHDEEGGRFIIQWHNLRPAEGFTYQQFQLVLLDPLVWPTESGQGDMLMYYNSISPTMGENAVTVGLENYTANGGLTYVYNNIYPSMNAPLANGTALLVTSAPVLESTRVPGPATLPAGFSLDAVAPNPFNPSTTVRYSLGREGRVSWTLVNLLGQKVASGRYGQQMAGEHTFRVDGAGLASGIYLLNLEAELSGGGHFSTTRKLALVR